MREICVHDEGASMCSNYKLQGNVNVNVHSRLVLVVFASVDDEGATHVQQLQIARECKCPQQLSLNVCCAFTDLHPPSGMESQPQHRPPWLLDPLRGQRAWRYGMGVRKRLSQEQKQEDCLSELRLRFGQYPDFGRQPAEKKRRDAG